MFLKADAKWIQSPLHALKDRRWRDEADILVPSALCDGRRAGAGGGQAGRRAGVGGKSSRGGGEACMGEFAEEGSSIQATVRAGSEKRHGDSYG